MRRRISGERSLMRGIDLGRGYWSFLFERSEHGVKARWDGNAMGLRRWNPCFCFSDSAGGTECLIPNSVLQKSVTTEIGGALNART